MSSMLEPMTTLAQSCRAVGASAVGRSGSDGRRTLGVGAALRPPVAVAVSGQRV